MMPVSAAIAAALTLPPTPGAVTPVPDRAPAFCEFSVMSVRAELADSSSSEVLARSV
jgi:hypothetical protein